MLGSGIARSGMKNPESHAGTAGWIGLGTYILVWDVLSPETLSSAMDRYLEHDKLKYVAWAAGGIVTAHLFNIIPEEYDILQQTSDFVGDMATRWKK